MLQTIETNKYVEAMKTISKEAGKKFVSTARRLEIKGIEKEKKRIALTMLKMNLIDSIILEATKLTQEQLDYLKDMKRYQIDLGI